MSLKNDQKLKEQTHLALNLLQRKFRLVSKKTSPTTVGIYWDDLKDYGLTPKVFAEAVCLLEEYGLKITGNYDEDALSVYDASGEGEEPTCFDILLPPDFESAYESIIEPASSGAVIKLRFDNLQGILRYGDRVHSFHRGQGYNDKKKLKLFKLLWADRKYLKREKVVIKGKPNTAGFLASQIGISEGALDFDRTKGKKKEFANLIKGINRTLRNKNFPAKIERKGAVQMLVSEQG